MTQRRMGSQVIQAVKVVVVCGCVIGLLMGCSSRLLTTTMSGSEAQKVKVTQLEPERVIVEEVVAPPLHEETKLDIPVEEPARPAPRREFPSEIFASSKSADVPSEFSSRPESASTSQGEQLASSMPSASESAIQTPARGIPPISSEPELSAEPTLREDQASFELQEPLMTSPPQPLQVAKVMPQEPDEVKITTATLEEVLSDIYFDYDRFSIREDAERRLQANAKLLSEKLADAKIVIEGHCDERGTQSYNMVLGEARANAVKTFLEDLGVSGDKLEVVSYGKDKPFCQEATEECWQENRRGHFVIK